MRFAAVFKESWVKGTEAPRPQGYCLGTVLGWGNALGTRLTLACIVHPGFFFWSRGLLQSKPSGSEDEKACVASVSVLFRSKERGARVKDRAKNGASRRGRESVGVGNDLRRLRLRLRAFLGPGEGRKVGTGGGEGREEITAEKFGVWVY